MSRGHKEYDVIHEYSLPKIMAYSEAARENESQMLFRLSVATRFATNGDQKEFKKYAESLLPKPRILIAQR